MRKMYKYLISSLLIVISFSSFAQYNKPYRITYEQVEKAYYVTNFDGNYLVKIDSFYQTSKLSNSFSALRDVDAISLNGKSILVVIDGKKIKALDATTLKSQIELEITSSTTLSDFVFDSKSNEFYVSDYEGGTVYKGNFGTAPLFKPSYTSWITSISRPKGLAINNNGSLMIVSDDTSAGIYSANASTGKVTLELKTNIDSLNHIVQDKEGNYFVSNWGDSYLYRVDPDFKSATKLTGYNKPSGMYFNAQNDLFLIACHLCNKVEYERLHYFQPAGSIYGCQGDSVYVNFDIGINGLGTYDADNQFVVELSDVNGNFDNPMAFGSVKSTIKPASIRAKLPFAQYSANSLFRIKSTHPEFYSSALTIGAFEAPNPDEYLISDTVICAEETIKINKKGYVGKTSISSSTNLSGALDTSLYFKSSIDGSYSYIVGFEDATTGCISKKTVMVEVTPKVQKNWNSDFFGCYDEDVIMVLGDTNYRYSWPISEDLSDSIGNSNTYSGSESTSFIVQLTTVNGACSATDTVNITKGKTIRPILIQYKHGLCPDDVLTITKPKYPNNIYELSDSAFFFWEDDVLKYKYDTTSYKEVTLITTDTHNCVRRDTFFIWSYPFVEVDSFSLTFSPAGEDPQNAYLYFNFDVEDFSAFLYTNGDCPESPDVFEKYPVTFSKADSVFTLTSIDCHFGEAYLVIQPDGGCHTNSDTIAYARSLSAVNLNTIGVKVYPNPGSDFIHIEADEGQITAVSVMDYAGREVLFKTDIEGMVDVSSLKSGYYILKVELGNGKHAQKPFVKR